MTCMECIRNSATLPRILIFGLVLAFVIEFVIHVCQIFHLSEYKSTDFENAAVYVILCYVLDVTKLTSMKLFINICFDFILVVTLLPIWTWIHEIYVFTIFVCYLQYFVVDLPFQIIQTSVLATKYYGKSAFSWARLLDGFLSKTGTIAGELLLLFMFSLFGRCTYLGEKADRNPDPDLADNTEENPHSHSCLFGKFWLICFVLMGSGLFVITAFLPKFYMMDSYAYSTFAQSSSASAIKNLTSTVGFPFDDVLISRSARDSGSPNAYLAGFIEKKIFVTETLINWMSENELCAVIGHELGHWKHLDLVKGFFVSLSLVLIASLIIRGLSNRGLSDMGFGDELPLCVLMILTMLFFKPINTFLCPCVNAISRSFELRADCYSAKLGLPIGDALKHLVEVTKLTFDSSPIYAFFYEDHPQLADRISGIQECLSS